MKIEDICYYDIQGIKQQKQTEQDYLNIITIRISHLIGQHVIDNWKKNNKKTPNS